MIAVAHPDRALAVDKKTLKQRSRLTGSQQFGMTEFALSGRHNLASEMKTHQLHAVADTQHRHTKFEQFSGNGWCSRFIDRHWTARENYPVWRKGADGL